MTERMTDDTRKQLRERNKAGRHVSLNEAEAMLNEIDRLRAEREDAQAAYADIPAIVREICEHREIEPCWLDTDGDCGNWKECSPDCPLAKLRKLAGYTYQNDNGDLGPVAAKPNPGQPILDANAKLRTQNADLMAALQNLCLEIRDYNPTDIDLGPAVAAIAQAEGGKQ